MKRHKFNAKRTQCELNHNHPSKLEASVCKVLQVLMNLKQISNLKYQHTVHLDYGRKWKVDFSYQPINTAETVWVEAKGVEDSQYKMNLAMWKRIGPGKLEIWKGTAARPYLKEVVVPENKLKETA